MTLTFDLWPWPRYSSTWPPCRNSGRYVCPFIRKRKTNTHTQKDGRTDRAKTITPVASLMQGAITWLVELLADSLIQSGIIATTERDNTLAFSNEVLDPVVIFLSLIHDIFIHRLLCMVGCGCAGNFSLQWQLVCGLCSHIVIKIIMSSTTNSWWK